MNKNLKRIAKQLKRQSIKVPLSWKGKGFSKRADFVKDMVEYVIGPSDQAIYFSEVDCRWLSSLIVSAFPFAIIDSGKDNCDSEEQSLYYYDFRRKRFCNNASLFLANLLQYLNISITPKGIRRLILNIEGWAWTGDILVIKEISARNASML